MLTIKHMRKRLKHTITVVAGICLLLTGCYKEEHFDMPNEGGGGEQTKDSMPDPFDGSNTVYLIKDGVPDYTRMSVLAFTDFAVEMPATEEQSSWYQGVDFNGKPYFGCRQHMNFKPLNTEDHFGGNALSYMYNSLQSRIYLANGNGKNWKVKIRMAVETLGQDEQSIFSLEGALGWSKRTRFSIDWTTGSVAYFFMGRNGQQYAYDGGAVVNTMKYISPNEPFELEFRCVNNFYYVFVEGHVIWAYQITDGSDHVFPFQFWPWKNGVRLYDLSIEGDYVAKEPVAVQHEKEYVTIQAPALAYAGDKLMLFAEGRRENVVQSAKMTSVRSNATDLLMKTSTDGGQSWTDWTVLKGGDGQVYLRPEVINAGDKLYLFYTVDLNGKQDGHYEIRYLQSADAGSTWTEGSVLNVALDGYSLMTLSGHGIKTSGGQLVFPIQCLTGKKGTVAVIYSEDNGGSWHLGNPVSGLRNHSAGIVEANGQLLMYTAHSSGGKSRKVVKSTDGGRNWTEPVDATIPSGESGQQVAGATVQDANGRIWHFTPQGIERTASYAGSSVGTDPMNGSAAQKKFYLYRPAIASFGKGYVCTVSDDGGQTWSAAEDLVGFTSFAEYSFPVGAADAVVAGDQVIAVVESGSAVPYEGLLIFRKAMH